MSKSGLDDPDDNYCFTIGFFTQKNPIVDSKIVLLADLDA